MINSKKLNNCKRNGRLDYDGHITNDAAGRYSSYHLDLVILDRMLITRQIMILIIVMECVYWMHMVQLALNENLNVFNVCINLLKVIL